MPTETPSFSSSLRISLILSACCSCVPCEKFMRATFIPERISFSSNSSLLLAGPMVATIFTLRVISFHSSIILYAFHSICLNLLLWRRLHAAAPKEIDVAKRYHQTWIQLGRYIFLISSLVNSVISPRSGSGEEPDSSAVQIPSGH